MVPLQSILYSFVWYTTLAPRMRARNYYHEGVHRVHTNKLNSLCEFLNFNCPLKTIYLFEIDLRLDSAHAQNLTVEAR